MGALNPPFCVGASVHTRTHTCKNPCMPCCSSASRHTSPWHSCECTYYTSLPRSPPEGHNTNNTYKSFTGGLTQHKHPWQVLWRRDTASNPRQRRGPFRFLHHISFLYISVIPFFHWRGIYENYGSVWSFKNKEWKYIFIYFIYPFLTECHVDDAVSNLIYGAFHSLCKSCPFKPKPEPKCFAKRQSQPLLQSPS